jgi:hypothetical protein
MNKKALNADRIRKIKGSFSFIPHRFIRDSFINELNSSELLLYFFLILVSDGKGISYYSDKSVCKFTELSFEEVDDARSVLKALDLIAFRSPIYQVLELPFKPVKRNSIYQASNNFRKLQKISQRNSNNR